MNVPSPAQDGTSLLYGCRTTDEVAEMVAALFIEAEVVSEIGERSFDQFGSTLRARITVCGVLLDPPEPHSLSEDDLGRRWWPEDKPFPTGSRSTGKNRAAKLQPIPK